MSKESGKWELSWRDQKSWPWIVSTPLKVKAGWNIHWQRQQAENKTRTYTVQTGHLKPNKLYANSSNYGGYIPIGHVKLAPLLAEFLHLAHTSHPEGMIRQDNMQQCPHLTNLYDELWWCLTQSVVCDETTYMIIVIHYVQFKIESQSCTQAVWLDPPEVKLKPVRRMSFHKLFMSQQDHAGRFGCFPPNHFAQTAPCFDRPA